MHKSQSESLLLPFLFYLLFFLEVDSDSSLSLISWSSPDNKFSAIYSRHSKLVDFFFFSLQNSENLHATLFHIMTVHYDCKFYHIAFVFFGA